MKEHKPRKNTLNGIYLLKFREISDIRVELVDGELCLAITHEGEKFNVFLRKEKGDAGLLGKLYTRIRHRKNISIYREDDKWWYS